MKSVLDWISQTGDLSCLYKYISKQNDKETFTINIHKCILGRHAQSNTV